MAGGRTTLGKQSVDHGDDVRRRKDNERLDFDSLSWRSDGFGWQKDGFGGSFSVPESGQDVLNVGADFGKNGDLLSPVGC